MEQGVTLTSTQVELALEEAGIPHEKYQIDLQNKPEWYAPKVNPASKVPAVAYGGPAVPADQPSPESTKIAESLCVCPRYCWQPYLTPRRAGCSSSSSRT